MHFSRAQICSSMRHGASRTLQRQWRASYSVTRVVRNANVRRPQDSFKDTIDNSRDTPFRPRIVEKPHASSPLRVARTPSPPRMDESIEAHVRSLGVDVEASEQIRLEALKILIGMRLKLLPHRRAFQHGCDRERLSRANQVRYRAPLARGWIPNASSQSLSMI